MPAGVVARTRGSPRRSTNRRELTGHQKPPHILSTEVAEQAGTTWFQATEGHSIRVPEGSDARSVNLSAKPAPDPRPGRRFRSRVRRGRPGGGHGRQRRAGRATARRWPGSRWPGPVPAQAGWWPMESGGGKVVPILVVVLSVGVAPVLREPIGIPVAAVKAYPVLEVEVVEVAVCAARAGPFLGW